MKKLVYVTLTIVITTLLAGCATPQYYAAAVNSWQGASQEEVYHVWGYPTRTNTLPNGHKVLVYNDHYTEQQPTYVTPGSTTVVQRPNGTTKVITTSDTVSGGGVYSYRCTTWFELGNNGRVVNTSFRGNNCVATKQYMMTHTYQG